MERTLDQRRLLRELQRGLRAEATQLSDRVLERRLLSGSNAKEHDVERDDPFRIGLVERGREVDRRVGEIAAGVLRRKLSRCGGDADDREREWNRCRVLRVSRDVAARRRRQLGEGRLVRVADVEMTLVGEHEVDDRFVGPIGSRRAPVEDLEPVEALGPVRPLIGRGIRVRRAVADREVLQRCGLDHLWEAGRGREVGNGDLRVRCVVELDVSRVAIDREAVVGGVGSLSAHGRRDRGARDDGDDEGEGEPGQRPRTQLGPQPRDGRPHRGRILNGATTIRQGGDSPTWRVVCTIRGALRAPGSRRVKRRSFVRAGGDCLRGPA